MVRCELENGNKTRDTTVESPRPTTTLILMGRRRSKIFQNLLERQAFRWVELVLVLGCRREWTCLGLLRYI